MKLMPSTLRPVASRLLLAMDECHAGTLEPRVLQALAAGANALTRTVSVGLIEERVAALERGTVLHVEEAEREQLD